MNGPVELARATWVEADRVAAERVLVIPVGSLEQHGPHLPLDTDTRIAVELVHRASVRLPDRIVVAPPVAYGASGEHAGFTGTLSIGTGVLTAVLVELARSADAHGAVCFVNGHGGNADAVRTAVATLRGEGRRVSAWSPSIPGGDAHAGHTETSLLLAIAPEVVHMDAARPGRTEPVDELIDALRAGGVGAVSPDGVLGDPTTATAVEGERLLGRLVDDLVAFLNPPS